MTKITKVFNSLEEIEKYYDKKSNTYIFMEDGSMIDNVVLNFDLKAAANIDAFNITGKTINVHNINANDINAQSIIALDIYAWDIYAKKIISCNIRALDITTCYIRANNIRARNIVALDISYYAVCYAEENIRCNSIKGRRTNSKHFVLDGTLEVIENEI